MFCFCQPPAQSGERNTILPGKCGAREATTPELLNHLQPLVRSCVMLPPGDRFGFHAPSVAKGSRRR
jgi:hypothetical protein